MKVKDLLEHLDGADISVTDWAELNRPLAEAGVTLATELNEAQWTDTADRGQSAEERALTILIANDLDARLQHTGGGVWVAEETSPTIPDRTVWVADSEGAEDGPFLVGVYPDKEGQAWFESLSGPCPADDLPARVKIDARFLRLSAERHRLDVAAICFTMLLLAVGEFYALRGLLSEAPSHTEMVAGAIAAGFTAVAVTAMTGGGQASQRKPAAALLGYCVRFARRRSISARREGIQA